MRRTMNPRRLGALGAALLALAGCTIERSSDRDEAPPAAAGGTPTASPAPGGTAAAGGALDDRALGDTGAAGAAAADSAADPTRLPPAERPRTEVRLEVDVKARQLHVLRGDTRTASYPVGVGTAQWPTQTGEWVVSQVVWNPEWVPPRDESWAEDREAKGPGEPDNPLGRAQLVYDLPRTVHGTNKPESVGNASSHGSIRMRNPDITRLARELQEAAGATRDEAWYQAVAANRTTKQIVDLPRVVPIRVY